MHKKTIIITILLVIFTIFLVVLCLLLFNNLKNKKVDIDSYLEFANENDKSIFSIDKITYFSNCSANISTNTNSSFKISDLYQYTDIAIFINNHIEEFDSKYTAENTLKSVTIDKIDFSLKPSHGTPNLYYKSINDFAKSSFDNNNLIKDTITFETTSGDEIDYTKPILYNNCANPITLCYVNSNIKDNYTLSDEIENIEHNGSLLKTCGITLNSISCQVSLVVNITTNLDETFICPLTLNIPLSTESSTIYDGNLTLKDSTNYNFIKTQ